MFRVLWIARSFYQVTAPLKLRLLDVSILLLISGFLDSVYVGGLIDQLLGFLFLEDFFEDQLASLLSF